MGEHRAEGKTNRLAYSDQYWIVANSLEGLEFTPLTVVEESMDSPFAVRSPDGTVTKRIVRDLVFDALSHGAEAPFLFARVESQSMFLVGWWYSGEKHAIVAHDDSEALACYYSLVGENKCEEIYEDARGMSEREFREQFVDKLSPSMYIDIADDEGTTTSTVGEIVRQAMSVAEEFPKFFGILKVINPEPSWELPLPTYVRFTAENQGA